MTKRILHQLTIHKIAAVDFPCQEPAVVAIMKAAEADFDALLKGKYSADDRKTMAGKEAMADGSYPIKDGEDLKNAVRAVGRGRNSSHAAIRRHVTARAKTLGLSTELPDTWSDSGKISKGIFEAITKAGVAIYDPDGDEGAQSFDDALGEQKLTQDFWDAFFRGTDVLRTSLVSILKDEDVADKGPMVTESLKEFAAYIEKILPGEVGKSLAAGVAAMFTGGAGQTVQGETRMDAIKKQLGLPATATEADVTKALEAQAAELAKAKEDAKLASMTDVQKAYMEKAKMSDDEKKKFKDGSPADREACMKAKPLPSEDDEVEKALRTGDAYKTEGGMVVMKSKVGDVQFAVMKAQHVEMQGLRADVAKRNENDLVKQYEDTAEGLGFEKAFGATIRKAYSGDAVAQAEMQKQIAALRKQAEAGGVFKEFGGRGAPTAGSAEAELIAKRDELMKANDKLSPEQAYSRVYKAKENKAVVERYKAEQALPN